MLEVIQYDEYPRLWGMYGLDRKDPIDLVVYCVLAHMERGNERANANHEKIIVEQSWSMMPCICHKCDKTQEHRFKAASYDWRWPYGWHNRLEGLVCETCWAIWDGLACAI